MSTPPSSLACERNKGPILEVLRKELRDRGNVLEIGSGTGQHAVFFGEKLPHLTWHTSDLPENHAAIRQWLDSARLKNVRSPLALNVSGPGEPAVTPPDAVFSANTAHIMDIDAVRDMFSLAGRLLPADGVFCLYGPFNFGGDFSSDSNADFDTSLRSRDPSMGIRDIEELDRFAADAGLSRVRLYAMPANNHLAVWRKASGGSSAP